MGSGDETRSSLSILTYTVYNTSQGSVKPQNKARATVNYPTVAAPDLVLISKRLKDLFRGSSQGGKGIGSGRGLC